jgi:hypothetical protein
MVKQIYRVSFRLPRRCMLPRAHSSQPPASPGRAAVTEEAQVERVIRELLAAGQLVANTGGDGQVRYSQAPTGR